MSGRSECMDVKGEEGRWELLLWVYSALHGRRISCGWQCRTSSETTTQTILRTQRIFDWTSKYLPGQTHMKVASREWSQGLVLQLFPVCTVCCQERRDVLGQAYIMLTSNKGIHSNADLISDGDWCITVAGANQCIVLPVSDWYTKLDSWIGVCRRVLGSLHDVVVSGISQTRIFGTILPHIFSPKEISQHQDVVWPDQPCDRWGQFQT